MRRSAFGAERTLTGLWPETQPYERSPWWCFCSEINQHVFLHRVRLNVWRIREQSFEERKHIEKKKQGEELARLCDKYPHLAYRRKEAYDSLWAAQLDWFVGRSMQRPRDACMTSLPRQGRGFLTSCEVAVQSE